MNILQISIACFYCSVVFGFFNGRAISLQTTELPSCFCLCKTKRSIINRIQTSLSSLLMLTYGSLILILLLFDERTTKHNKETEFKEKGTKGERRTNPPERWMIHFLLYKWDCVSCVVSVWVVFYALGWSSCTCWISTSLSSGFR